MSSVCFGRKISGRIISGERCPGGYCPDVDKLLENVQTISRHIPMNFLTVFGDNASTVVAGGYNDLSLTKIYLPVIAAGRIGQGKILGAYHKSVFNPSNIGNTSIFIVNAFTWVSPSSLPSTHVAIMPQQNRMLQDLLEDNSMSTTVVSNDDIDTIDNQAYQVVFSTDIGCVEAVKLLRFVDAGGGLIIAVTPAGNIGGHFGKMFPPNSISRNAGFVWGNTKSRWFNVTHIDNFIDTEVGHTSNTNVFECWKVVKSLDPAILDNPHTPLHQYGYVLLEGLQHIPKTLFTSAFYTEAQTAVQNLPQHKPSKAKSIVDPRQKFELLLFHALSVNVLTPDDVMPHDGRVNFPGDTTLRYKSHTTLNNKNLSPRQNNLRMTISPELDSRRKFSYLGDEIFWQSTEIYVIAGKPIELKISTDKCFEEFSVQVGSHPGILDYDQDWTRVPALVSVAYFESNVTKIASPYGGLLYIRIPPRHENIGKPRNFTIEVNGHYFPSKSFAVGSTYSTDWFESLKTSESSWVELEGNNVVITVSVAEAIKILEPEKVVLWWDNVIQNMMQLRGITQDSYRKFRFVYDYLTDSLFYTEPYPMPVNDDQINFLFNTSIVRPSTNYWEFLTNVGSNLMISDLVFHSMYTQLPSLFALYIFETLLYKPFYEAHPDINKSVIISNIDTYVQSVGKNYDFYANDPWLPFYTLLQLQMSFGWVYVTSILSSRDKVQNEGIVSDNSTLRNSFIVTSSNNVKLNLISLFQSWNWPIDSSISMILQQLTNVSDTIDSFLQNIS